jgi:cytochrome c553
MLQLPPAVLAASTVRVVGIVIALLALAGFVVYALVNIRAGRDEIGSEVELAPNRKPYFDDEQLEGTRLDRSLMSGLVMLGIVALGLPLYWLNEPGRQSGAVETFDEIFADRGEDLFATTAEGGFNCAGCHGPEGVGGVAPATLTTGDGDFVATASWKGPALNTVLLRYDESEVLDILIYGRPFSPMPPWGEDGGGPLTAQQLDELIAYMWSFQLTPEEARGEVEDGLRRTLDLGNDEEIDYDDPEVGEALFNLGENQDVAAGAYSCARCHTRGWSITDPIEPEDADIEEFVDWPDGSGAFGFSLQYPLIPRQFEGAAEMLEFVCAGSEFGAQYGRNGQGSGRMPGYCDNPNSDDEGDGMMTEEMVAAIVCYAQTLSDEAELSHGECLSDIAEAQAEAEEAERKAAEEAEAEEAEAGGEGDGDGEGDESEDGEG